MISLATFKDLHADEVSQRSSFMKLNDKYDKSQELASDIKMSFTKSDRAQSSSRTHRPGSISKMKSKESNW
jgi:hypothetical protein